MAPLQNKVGQFLSATVIRNIVAQVKSTIVMRDIMDTRKIFIVNLSKGRIGEENSRLLGAMIITRLQLSAMERVDMPEKDRQDFYLYVDEFQNFATESFANILSEARKYRLALVVAHQYIEQLDEMVRAAIFGNVGTIVAFRVGAADATFMEAEFTPRFTPEDLVNLKKYEVYLKLMIDGASSEPFSANTLPPIAEVTGSAEKVIRVSRERYSTPRKVIEEKVIKWSGFGTADTGHVMMTEDEEAVAIEAKIKELEKTSPDVGEMARPADGGGFGGAKKKKKAEFQVPCSVCGKISELTFEPDWSKPWFCKEHLEMKQKGLLPKAAAPPPIKVMPAQPKADVPPAKPMAAPLAKPAVLAPKPVMPAPAAAKEPSAPVPAPAVAPAPVPATPAVPEQQKQQPKAPPPKIKTPPPARPQAKAPDTKAVSLSALPSREDAAPKKNDKPQKPMPKQQLAATAEQIAGIPSQSHKPRIVTGGGEDDVVTEIKKTAEKPTAQRDAETAVPTAETKPAMPAPAAAPVAAQPPAPAAETKPVMPVPAAASKESPKQELAKPEPFRTSPEATEMKATDQMPPAPKAPEPKPPAPTDKGNATGSGGIWQPGQVIKF